MATTPAIPNTDRIVSYSPVGSTSAFIIPWPVIADSEILAEDDLVVIVNGTKLTSAQFSFSGNVITGLSGMWNGGTVTLVTAVAGVRVLIYSKRDPRRTGNYLEGNALPFTTLDKLTDDEIIQIRDLALSVGRAFKTSAANYYDNGSADMTFSAGTLEATVAAFLAGASPATAVAGWARTLATAKALYAAPVTLANGHTVSVAQRTSVGDGYGGLFSYDSSDAASTFSQDALGFVDNQGRRFKRVWGGTFAFASWFGAIGDNVTDDFTALQAALTTARAVLLDVKTYFFSGTLVIPANTKLAGCGPSSKLRQGNSNVINIEISVSNVQLSDFSLTGYGTNVIAIGKNGAANNITIERVGFLPTVATNLDQCISLYTCSNIRIDKCDFTATGYAIIQIATYVFSGLKVTGCYFSDMYGDAVLLNGAGSLGSMIEIGFNTFTGSHLWNTPATERRFVGITSDSDINIHHNFVQHCAGDAAVHIESTGTRILHNHNEYVDCNTNNQDGWIYILNSGRLDSSDNTFRKTDALVGTYSAYSTQSGAYGGPIHVDNDTLIDESVSASMNMFNLAFHSGETVISNCKMYSGLSFVTMITASNKQFIGNRVIGALNGIYNTSVDVASGSGSDNINIHNNHFDVSGWNIRSGKNTSGTQAPNKWFVTGNKLLCASGSHFGVLIQDLANGFGASNSYGANLTNFSIANSPGVNTVEKNDFKEGTGLIHP